MKEKHEKYFKHSQSQIPNLDPLPCEHLAYKKKNLFLIWNPKFMFLIDSRMKDFITADDVKYIFL